MQWSETEGEKGDVLSSIRRLVAEETANHARRRAGQDEAQPLLLGDALRVRGGEPEAAPETPSDDWPSFEKSRQRKVTPERGFTELSTTPKALHETPARFDSPATIEDPKEREERAPAPAESNFFDEEGLRTLVTDIVREEVKLALSEAFETKVRRLVKREVLAALELSAPSEESEAS
ncbi:MAG: hypothetical protein AAGA32_16885 [Pseudomonadota bacterium]